jgi:hypothetical protein
MERNFRREALSALERSWEAAFAAARNATGEQEFPLGTLVNVCAWLGETAPDLPSPPDASLAQIIVEQFVRRCIPAIAEGDIGRM